VRSSLARGPREPSLPSALSFSSSTLLFPTALRCAPTSPRPRISPSRSISPSAFFRASQAPPISASHAIPAIAKFPSTPRLLFSAPPVRPLRRRPVQFHRLRDSISATGDSNSRNDPSFSPRPAGDHRPMITNSPARLEIADRCIRGIRCRNDYPRPGRRTDELSNAAVVTRPFRCHRRPPFLSRIRIPRPL
jgi:hypothetical protein